MKSNSQTVEDSCRWKEQHRNRLLDYKTNNGQMGFLEVLRGAPNCFRSHRMCNAALESHQWSSWNTGKQLGFETHIGRNSSKLKTFFFFPSLQWHLRVHCLLRLRGLWTQSDGFPAGRSDGPLQCSWDAGCWLEQGPILGSILGLVREWQGRETGQLILESGRAVEALPADGVWAQAARRLECAKTT